MKNRLLFLPALLLALPLAFAQVPSGHVSFTFDRTTFPVWDFTGPYQLNQQLVGSGGSLPLSFPVNISHELSGGLSGAGTTMVTLGPSVVAANYVLSGAVSLSGNDTRAMFSVTLAGSGLNIIAGQQHSFHISLIYNLAVDPDPANPPALIAPARGAPVRGNVSIAGLSGGSVIPGEDFSVLLPPGVDGGWSVNMDILPLSRLAGTATIVIHNPGAPGQAAYLPTARTLNANLAGSYRPTLALSQVQLTGLPGSSPTSLDLTLVRGEAQPGRITGRILGQTVRY
jgi:hypothetical protein